MNTKICGTCKISYLASNDWFSKDSSKKDGLKTICKSCEKIKNHKRYLNNLEEHKAKNKMYYESHKEEIHKQTKQYRQNNADRIKEQKKKAYPGYMQRHGEEVRAKLNAYKQSHKEIVSESARRYYQNNKEKCVAARRKWNKEHREICIFGTQQYRSQRKNLECTLTIDQWERIKTHFDNQCAYCGREQSLVREHFVPTKSGGGFTQDNILPACASCNSSKGDKNFFEWYPKYRHYSKQREDKIKEYLSNSRE